MDLRGDVLPRELLARGFELDGVRVPLLGPQGIFKPKVLDVPLSLTTSPDSPYDDAFGEDDGLLHYRYRGDDPDHRDNRGMREAMRLGLPLAYFHGEVAGSHVMSTISLRLPESLHMKVRELAKAEDISINQFITTAVAEKMSALMTVDYLRERGALGDRAAYDGVLARVRDVEPDEGDEL